MSIEYRIDSETGIVHHGFTGEIALADLERHWRRLLADPELPEPLFMFADMRDCHVLLDGNETHYLAHEVIEPLLNGRRWVSSVVVGSTCDYGVTKQFIAYSGQFGETEVFMELHEAVCWLADRRELRRPAVCPEPDGDR